MDDDGARGDADNGGSLDGGWQRQDREGEEAFGLPERVTGFDEKSILKRRPKPGHLDRLRCSDGGILQAEVDVLASVERLVLQLGEERRRHKRQAAAVGNPAHHYGVLLQV